MTVDVSRLGIVVESTGIKEARKALDGGNGRGGLAGAADKAEKNVEKLSATVGKLLSLNTSGTAQAWNASMAQLANTMATLNASMATALKGMQALAPAFNKLAANTNRAASANERVGSSGNVVTNTLKAMTTAAAAYVAVNFVMSIVRQADSWQMLEARLTNATGSLHNARVAQQQMFDLSQRLRVPLEDSVKLYNRLAPAVQRMGKSSDYAKDMVEGIATALQLGGANGAEASSVMLQLSQSFSSGVLNGAEFNAIAENGSVLMRALEKQTGKSTYELKKLGSEGKLSMEIVGKAIQSNLPMWREQFDKLPMTFEGAMQRIKNAWTKAVGEIGQDTGFNQELSKALRVIEDMIPAVTVGLGVAFIEVMKWVEENKEMLEEVWTQIKGIGKDVWDIANGFSAWAGEIAGAGESFSVLGFMLYSARLMIAGFIDGLSLIKTVVAALGAVIYNALIGPLVWLATKGIALLLDGFAKVNNILGAAAENAGFTGMAKTYKNAATTASEWAVTLESVADASKGIGDALTATAGAFAAEFRDGKTAVQALLNEEQKLYTQRRTAGKMDEKAWGAGDPKKPIDAKAAKAAEVELANFKDQQAAMIAVRREQELLAKNLATYGLGYDKLTPSMKKAIELQEHLNVLQQGGKAGSAEETHTKILIALAERNALEETGNERTLERLKLEQALYNKEQTSVGTAREMALEAEKKLATYGMEKGALEELELLESRRAVAAFELLNAGSAMTLQDERMLAAMKEKVAWQERYAAARNGTGAREAADSFDKLFDARKAEKFGNVLAEGFGKAGKAIGQMANALGKYEARQAKVKEGRDKLALMDKDSVAYASHSVKLAEEEAEARMASYADMAGAAKGFFEEGTKGYKAMESAEKAFRVFQLAMQLKSFMQEMFFTNTAVATKVGGEAAKATAVVAGQAVETGAVVAGEATRNAAKVPGVFMAFMSALGPWGMAAAAVAIAAVMGSAMGGGGGNVSADRQKAQGTGTVMGDSEAKSESISKALEILSKNSDIALRYSSGMLSSLQNIEYSLTSATSGVLRTGGSVTGKGYEGAQKLPGLAEAAFLTGPIGFIGNALGKLIGGNVGATIQKLTGFSSSSSLKDSGLMGKSQSVGNIMSNGFNVSGYQDVQTKKKLFGLKYSDKTNTNLSAVDAAVSGEFGNVVTGMVESLVSAASVLGMSGEAVRAKLEAVNIDIGKISLKDLSSEEIQKQLEAVFSAIGDNLATIALPSVVAFQKAGEGLLETAVRVASGVEVANYELEKLGIASISLGDVLKTSGDVGAEIVRQSILAQEVGTGVGEIIKTLTGEAADIADTYKALTQVRGSLQLLGLADDVSRDMIRAAGGLDALQDALDAYTSNFFSDSEQQAMKLSALRKEFDKLGVTMPATKADFRTLVETLSASGATGSELATKVLLLAESFADLGDSADTLVSKARDDLSEAYERESQALMDVRDRFKEFAESLGEFKQSLLTGDLSVLDVASKYQVEKANFEQTLAKAKAGDADAIGAFQDVATSFLTASREMNASGSVYTSDFERVLAEIGLVQGVAAGKSTMAEQQLAALDKQVAGLLTVNESVISVAEAVKALTALLTQGVNGTDGPTMSILPVPPMAQTLEAKAYQTGQTVVASTDAMVAELSALRAEVVALKEGQTAQTGQLIASNYEANMLNASVIVEGSKEAASTTSYAERATTKLA